MRAKIHFDDGSKGFLLVLLISQLFFTNGIILFIGMAIFFILMNNLQQPYKPSVFTIMLIYHFIQISASVWESNYIGKDINYRSDNTQYAVIVSYIGLLILFLPIIFYQNKIPAFSLAHLKKEAEKLSINQTFRIYVISFFSMNALVGIAFLLPSLTQIIYSFANVKWFLFLLFGFQSILKKKKRKEFYIFCALEFAMGFYSYFSDFKTIIFFIALLLLSLMATVRFNKMILAVISMIILVVGGVFWTSIKDEYRGFLNKGSKTQSVQVEQGEALNKLLELSQKQDESSFTNAMDNFLDRLQYTYHMAKAMETVPAKIPYQEGANWGKTLTFILTPRALSPDKGIYDASEKTSKYTGIYYSGLKGGVSVSLGYFTDGYVDFGYIGMFFPILILGFIYGRTYFYFIKKASDNIIFNYAVVAAIYLELFAFESDNIYVAGRLYVNLVVFFLLKIFLFPRLMNYIRMPFKPKEEEPATA